MSRGVHLGSQPSTVRAADTSTAIQSVSVSGRGPATEPSTSRATAR